ncbi:unnamed protein product [Diamesa hyperborea]
MGDNIIKELPCGVFDTNTRLQQLYFTKNDLGKIGKDIFNPLPLLSLAHFRKNVCVDKDADKIEQVPGLRNEIAKKCATDCKKTGVYPALIKSCDSEYYQVIINELGKTVYTLNYKVDNLESNLDDQKEEYQQLNEEKENLEQIVNNITAINEGLTKDVNACMDENLKLTKEKDELDKQISELETKLSKSIEDAKENDEKLNTIINDKENNIIAKIEEVKTLGDKVDSLEKDLDNSKIENLRINKENDELNKKVSELEKQLSKSIEDALESYEKLNIIIMDKEDNIIANSKEIKTLGDKMDSLEKDLDASKIENLIINKENDKLNKEISEMGLKLSKSTQDAKNNDKKLNDIIINKDKIIVKNNGEIKKLKTDLNNSNASNKNLQKALAANILDKKIINRDETIIIKEKEIEILEVTVHSLEDDLAVSKNETVKISDDLKKLETTHIQTVDAAKQNEDKLNIALNELEHLENVVQNITEINYNLESDLKLKIIEHSNLEAEKHELNIILLDLETEHNKTIIDALEVTQSKAKTDNSLKILKAKIKELNIKIDDVTKSDLELKIIEHSNLEAEKAELNRILLHLETEHNKTIKGEKQNEESFNETILIMNSEIIEVNRTNKNLQTKLTGEKIKVKNLIQLKTKNEKSIKDLKAKITKLDSKITDVTRNNVKLTKELKTQIENLEKLKTKYNQTIQENKIEIKSFKDTITNITEINNKLETEMNFKIEEYYKLQEINHHLEQTVEYNEETMNNMNNTLLTKEETINTMNKTITTTENACAIHCTNDDLTSCKTKDFPTVMEKYSFINTTLKTFYETQDNITFKIENIVMTRLPNIIFKHYPKIIYFFVTRSGLKSIKNGNFNGASSLIQIGINLNDISDVEASVFQGARNVVSISLAHNNIERLSDRAFDGLNKLEELDLSNNKIKFLFNIIFVNLPSLNILHAEKNELTVLSGNLFKAEKAQLNRILLDSETEHNKTIRDAKQNEESFNETIRIKKSVIIEANRTNTILQTKLTDENVKVKNLNQTIESLIKDAEVLNSTLKSTENGCTIHCANDDLKTCKTKDFPIVVEYYSYINTTLKTFYETKDDTEFKIENEVMSRIPNIIFKHYPKIKYFFVIRSGLESIKNGNFDGASSLIRIGINYNNITYVEASVFEEAKNVMFISLAHNNIERLSDRAFDGLNKLEQLDLSNNKIKFLYKIIFINLPNLEILHVEMNALTALSGNLFI